MFTKILPATTLAVLLCALAAVPAKAAFVLGSHVDVEVWLNNMAPNSNGWAYFGDNLGPPSPFGDGGRVELKAGSSDYLVSFGVSDMAHENPTEIFGASAGAGSIYSLAESPVQRLFYFQANGTDLLLASDDNRQYTDGFSSGGTPGRIQGDLDIFYHADSHTWAFFFDDAGGGLPILGDDNDYDDLVVTFRSNNFVPEPGALGLLGVALFGLAGMVRRRKLG
jgi:hypothetical protein